MDQIIQTSKHQKEKCFQVESQNFELNSYKNQQSNIKFQKLQKNYQSEFIISDQYANSFQLSTIKLSLNMQKQEIIQRHHQFSLTFEEFCQKQQNLENYSFDKYLVLKKIGKGSFATVYRGIVIDTKQQVAIKVINMREVKNTPNQRLKQIKLRLADSQSRIMMLFDSINILKCYECFESDDFKFMVLEYCNGNDLATKIQKEGKIFQDEAVDILKQIVNGIGECHKKKIIHRDLKPENIMIHNGIYKIADFGFSKFLQIEGENQTCVNTTLGTPTTMAPQVRNFEPYGLKADIWSIGVIFYHMLFGKCPFESRGNHNKIALRITQNLTKEEFYEGTRVSDKARKFLRQTLVVDASKRLGWRDLIEHEIFQEEWQVLKESYGRQVSIVIKAEEMDKLQGQVLMNSKNLESKQQIQQSLSNILGSLVFADSAINQLAQEKQQNEQNNEQKLKTQIKMRQCSSRFVESTEFNMKQINQFQIRAANDQQMELYQWAKRTYLECLKTELIFKKIILPIETHKLLDLSSRKPIEFMYLLATRCYNNMSPVYLEYKEAQNSEIIQQLSLNMHKLYQELTVKWERYSYLLTQKENQKLQIVSDFAKKVINIFAQAYDYHKKEKFMTGIQSMGNFRKSYEVYSDSKMQKLTKGNPESDPSLKDYTKEEQIKYTQEYFLKIKSKFLKQDSLECKQVMSYMKKFVEICHVRLDDLKNMTFKQYVEKLIEL